MMGDLPNNTFAYNANLKKVTLKIPKVARIMCYWP